MAMRFADSFDHYAYSDLALKWTQKIAGGALSTIGSVGRNSTSGLNLKCGVFSATDRVCKVFGNASGATCIVSFAYKNVNAFSAWNNSSTENTNATGGSAATILSIRQGATTQVWFAINTSGQIVAYRGTTALGTSSSALSQNVYHYLEFKVVIDDSTGTVTVKMDGTTILTLTSQDTKATSSATWDEVCLGCFGAPGGTAIDNQYDDLIVMDGSGSYNNDFLGDRRVSALFPNAVGNSSGSVSSGGGGTADRYTMVDETSLNSDTDYNTFAATGDKDTYGCQNCPTSGAPVSAVVVSIAAKKADAGEAGVAAVARISGTDYDSATLGVPGGYVVQQAIWDRSAVDGTTAWTTAVIDAAEFGVKKAS
ncbi:MAG TPA: hypothetical protein VFP27_12065 [Mycobacterium sp.]|nr:hypothetical protein [Mycobacterium sp.]